jgi:hypothetical protein
MRSRGVCDWGVCASCMEASAGHKKYDFLAQSWGGCRPFYSRHHCGSGEQMCWHAAGPCMVLSGWRWGQLGLCGLDMSLAGLWFCGVFCSCSCFGAGGYRCPLAAQGRGLFGECCMWQDVRCCSIGRAGADQSEGSPMLLRLGSFTLAGTQSTCRLLSLAQCGGELGACSMW